MEVVPPGDAAKAGGWSEAAPPDSWEELEMIDIVTERPLEGSASASAASAAAAAAAAAPGSSQQHQHQDAARQGNVNEGMGQGVRRQCAAVLNSFWVELYDLHGQPAGGAASAGRPDDRAPFLQPEQQQQQQQHQEVPEGEQRRVRRCLEDLCAEGVRESPPLSCPPFLSPSSLPHCNNEEGGVLTRHAECLARTQGAVLLRRHCRDSQALAPFELYVASLCPVAGGASAPELLPLQQHQHHLAAAPSGPVSSFGVWCILRLLQLLQEEPRPELWGRYGGVLNRLQVQFWPPLGRNSCGVERGGGGSCLSFRLWAKHRQHGQQRASGLIRGSGSKEAQSWNGRAEGGRRQRLRGRGPGGGRCRGGDGAELPSL